jgi:quercetin dioxygenase-like cupin family protein
MIFRDSHTGEKLDVAGLNEITVIIDRSETKLSESAINRWKPGLLGPPHKHEQKEQIFFIIGGEGEVKIGNDVFPAKPGDLLFVPANVVHQTINRGKESLDYFLFNAFLNEDKEGHVSFAEHVNLMKGTRLAQANAQSASIGSGQPLASSNTRGRYFKNVTSIKLEPSSGLSQSIILPRQQTQRSEAAILHLPANGNVAFETDNAHEHTIFVLSGSGTFSSKEDSKEVSGGEIIYIAGNSKLKIQTRGTDLNCLVLSSVI